MKMLLVLSLLFISGNTFSQTTKSLSARLKSFIAANDKMDFKTVVEYIYPKLSADQSKENMTDGLISFTKNENWIIVFDSLKVDSISPIFTTKNGSYAKINAHLKMVIKAAVNKTQNNKDDSMDIASDPAFIKATLIKFAADDATIDKDDVTIFFHHPFIAIKDKYAEDWCFTFPYFFSIGSQIDNLFTKEVADKLAIYP